MLELATRRRTQPPPPHVVFEALANPSQDPHRHQPWLALLADEVPPRVIDAEAPVRVVWSSLWPYFESVIIRFDLEPISGETALRWTLQSDQPIDVGAVWHMRSRINRLINAELRYTFGN